MINLTCINLMNILVIVYNNGNLVRLRTPMEYENATFFKASPGHLEVVKPKPDPSDIK